MTDKDFIKYLAFKLLHSGEDCCSMCAYSPADDLCENHKKNSPPDDEICTAGLREYAERKANKK